MGDVVFTVLFLLGILVVIVAIIMAVTRRRLVTLWRPKYTYIGLGFYIVLGVMAMIFVQQQGGTEQVSDAELQQGLQAEMQMRDALFNASFSELNPQYLKKQWTFPVSGDTVTVNYTNQIVDRVYINHDAEEGNAITLSYYATPTILYRLNVSKFVELPTVSFTDDTLQVYFDMNHHRFQYNKMQPVLGFLEASAFYNTQIDDSVGTYALYLNVPQNVHIINEGGY